MRKKRGFTLTETLITLIIIGIIAAMTIPNLIYKGQEQGLRSAFLKTYSIIKQAHQMSIINDENFYNEDHKCNSFHINPIFQKNPELMKQYFKIAKGPYRKNGGEAAAKIFKNLYNDWNDSTLKYLNGEAAEILLKNASHFIFQTEDGAIISFFIANCHSYSIYVDVNGAKGPNTIGKDIYLLQYTGVNGNNWSPIKNNPGLFNQIVPWGLVGTQNCGCSILTSESASDCKKSGKGLTCTREITKDRNFEIK